MVNFSATVGVGVGDAVAVAVGDGVAVAVGDGVAVMDGDAVDVAVGVEVGVAEGVPLVGEAVGVEVGTIVGPTVPCCTTIALITARLSDSAPPAAKVPVVGSKISVELSIAPLTSESNASWSSEVLVPPPTLPVAPPIIITSPLFKRTAEWPARAVIMVPVAANLFSTGSEISALPMKVYPAAAEPLIPPANRIRPSLSTVALAPARPALITELHAPEVDPPIHENVPAVGS